MAQPLVLVTGATGFIAKHTIAELLRRGYPVRGSVRRLDRGDDVRRAVTRAGADPSGLSIVAADLLSDEGWDAALQGCRYVLHTASPFPVTQPDNADDVVKPARDGTLRVLAAAAKAGVKRVVLTSSTVAVMYAARPEGHIFSEDDWSDLDRGSITPYIRSKTLAERSAWDFVKSTPGAPELSVINPAFVQGPALDADLSTSHEVLRFMAQGLYPASPKITFPVCDVRDVAIAHAEAMTSPKAAGERFIIAGGETRLYDIGQRLAAACPDLKSKVPKVELPDFAVRVLAIFDKRLRTIKPELGRHRVCTNRKAREVLGLTLRGPDEAITAAARSLRDMGLV